MKYGTLVLVIYVKDIQHRFYLLETFRVPIRKNDAYSYTVSHVELYMKHMLPIIKYVQSKGLRVLIWDGILIFSLSPYDIGHDEKVGNG